MKKIPSVFQRNYETDRLVRDEVVPGCEWVLAGEGVATRKWDGTACLVRDGKLYKRYDAKHGKTPPEDWEPCEPEPDPQTGHWPGWLPVGDSNEDRWFRDAQPCFLPAAGTYELVGPRVNGGHEEFTAHHLLRHGEKTYDGCPRDYKGLQGWLSIAGIEGIVFHHPDGRMAKVKARDFGLSWPRKDAEEA